MDPNYIPTDQDRKFAEAATERARLQAAAYLPQLLDIMVEKALADTATAKTVQDAAEFTYKVSGLAKRQEEVKSVPSFSVRIILPGQNKELVIGSGSTSEPVPPVKALDETNILDAIPSHVTDLDLSENLDFDLGDMTNE